MAKLAGGKAFDGLETLARDSGLNRTYAQVPTKEADRQDGAESPAEDGVSARRGVAGLGAEVKFPTFVSFPKDGQVVAVQDVAVQEAPKEAAPCPKPETHNPKSLSGSCGQ